MQSRVISSPTTTRKSIYALAEVTEFLQRWFQPKDFQFDAEAQTCVCPQGKTLKLSTANAVIKGRRGMSFEGSAAICGACPLRAQCLRKPGVSVYRQVTFFDGSKTKDLHPPSTAMKARINT